MSKFILFLFVGLMVANIAKATTPAGDDGSTETQPLMNTPKLCECAIKADLNVPVGQDSDHAQRGEPIKAKVRDALNLKNEAPADKTKALNDGDAG